MNAIIRRVVPWLQPNNIRFAVTALGAVIVGLAGAIAAIWKG